MLHLQKNTLVTGLSKNLVEIRQLEVDWYLNNYGTIAGQATMVCGFAMSQLTTSMPDPEPPYLMELGYVSLTSLAVGLELTAILLSTFLSTWAPSLALRGKMGSTDLHRAIDTLRDYQSFTFGVFMLGLVLFFVSSIFQIWIYNKSKVASVVTIAFVGFLVGIVGITWDLTAKLQLDEGEAVTGKVEHFHVYENIADLDHSLTSMGAREFRRVGEEAEGEGRFGTCPTHAGCESFRPMRASERESERSQASSYIYTGR